MPLRARLPSSGSLFMFEAAARHRNFTLAAREFNVTQPAISRMISRLEQHLGATLFLRKAGGLELTAEGRLLFRAVRDGFERIEDTVCEIESRAQDPEVVTVSVTSAFAIHWLMARFDRFRREVPGVTMRLDLIHGEPLGRIGAADLGLRYNMPEGEDIESMALDSEMVIPVCGPTYREEHGLIDGPGGMKGQMLAGLMGRMRIPWTRYIEVMGIGPLRDATELSFSDYALVIQGAIKGQGVALGWWHVIAGEVLSGGLVPASTHFLRTGASYHLVTRRSAAARPAVRKVRDWLVAEFAGLEASREALGLIAVHCDLSLPVTSE